MGRCQATRMRRVRETDLDEAFAAVGRDKEAGEGARAGVEAAWMRGWTDGRVSDRQQASSGEELEGEMRTKDDRVWLGGHRMGGDEGGGRCEEEGGRKEEGGERRGGRFGTDTW